MERQVSGLHGTLGQTFVDLIQRIRPTLLSISIDINVHWSEGSIIAILPGLATRFMRIGDAASDEEETVDYRLFYSGGKHTFHGPQVTRANDNRVLIFEFDRKRQPSRWYFVPLNVL